MAGVNRVEAKLFELSCRVESTHLPTTTNTIQRFCRAFQRFYRALRGFHSFLSDKRALLSFWIVDVLAPRSTIGQARIDVIVPEARRMLLYQLIDDPFRALQERECVMATGAMVNLRLPRKAAA